MNKALVRVCLILMVAVIAQPLPAQNPAGECPVSPGVGASLLFPYFEVSIGDAGGVTTLISVNNALSGPVLARLVMWTDWGIPTAAFDIYLGAFDVQTINVRDLLNGVVPATGAGANLAAFDGCDVDPPTYPSPVFGADEVAQIQADHQGIAGPLSGATCSGQAYGDGIARGYITVDTVGSCAGAESVELIVTPLNSAIPYFGSKIPGHSTLQNALWGDLFFVDAAGNAAQGMDAVAIWADPSVFFGPNVYTFYGRYTFFDGADSRVPLPNVWNQRFANGGPFAGGAQIILWQDNGQPGPPETAVCGFTPSWAPLESTITALDENGQNAVLLADASFPVMTQRVDVGTLGIGFPFGWVQIDTPNRQSWAQPTLTAEGRFSAGVSGVPVGVLCDETPLQPLR